MNFKDKKKIEILIKNYHIRPDLWERIYGILV